MIYPAVQIEAEDGICVTLGPGGGLRGCRSIG